jgi:N-acetylneuraminic acid mutarotase
MKQVFLLFSLISAFNSTASSWVQKADFGAIGRHRGTGLSIINKGYMGLGHVNGSGVDISYKDWWEYDPASNSWTQKADFPTKTHGAVAFTVGNIGYVGGGSALNGEFYGFDPISNTWTPTALCPIYPTDVQAFSTNNKGYVYNTTTLVEYNPITNSWATKATPPILFNTWCSSFSNSSSGFVKSGNKLYEYKAALNTWLIRAQFPGLMTNGSSAFSINGKGYFACGYVGGLSNVTDEVWEFNPATNTWTQFDEFLGSTRRFQVAFSIFNKGYMGTGTNGINFNDFWEFDPSFNYLSVESLSKSFEACNIYPNPVQSDLNFSNLPENLLEKSDIVIYDAFGKEVITAKLSNKISCSSLDPGYYTLTIRYSNQLVKQAKFIKL